MNAVNSSRSGDAESHITHPEVIWLRMSPRRKGPKPAYSFEDIARAATGLADREGLEAVSIRAVASELGAGAASLYRYIERKDDLYDLMVDLVSSEYSLPDAPSGDWRADITLIADRARGIYQRHSWVADLISQVSWGPNVQKYMDFFLAALEPTALDLGGKMEFIAMLSGWVASHVSQGQRVLDATTTVARMRHLSTIANDSAHPYLSRAVSAMLEPAALEVDADELFRRGLNRLIAGVMSAGTD